MQQGGLKLSHSLADVPVRAQLLCTAGTMATAVTPCQYWASCWLSSTFLGGNSNCFWLLKSLGDSAVLSRINFWTEGLTLIQPLVHRHFQLSLEA